MAVMDTVLRFFIGSRNERLVKSYQPRVDAIMELFPRTNALSDEELAAKTSEFRQRMREGETLDDLMVEAFACVREASWRVLGGKRLIEDPITGEELPFKAHFPVQLMGGMVLHDGLIAEMVTGEGKTFVATLAVYLNALEAQGVHVITVNDYLARRDGEEQGRVLAMVGMSCGWIQSDMDNEERRAMYARDVTYGTNNEFGFDYLRDNMKIDPKQQCQRNLHYAIVDEVDSILIDEARTPLIISGAPEGVAERYDRADEIAKTLKGIDSEKAKERVIDKYGKGGLMDKGLYLAELDAYDYELKEKESQCLLTERGIKRVETALGIKHLYDGEHMAWPHLIEQALRANNLFKEDKDYVVDDTDEGREIIIVDEFTGRKQHGRRWSDGLHQAMEAKHGMDAKAESWTLATITLQNYFKLYGKLAGMTGTAMTEASEFAKVYKLEVIALPTNRPLIRKMHNDLIYGSDQEKWDAVVQEIKDLNEVGRPMLVGTTSVERSEHLSRLLITAGVTHNVLNAKYHMREADIIAQAGRKGAVTVATNMAGRGTDILLGGNAKYMALKELRKEGLEVENFLPEEMRDGDTWEIPRDVQLRAEVEFDDAVSDRAKKFEPAVKAEHEEIVKLGGLAVIGSERHESRRIDNQLRGRCGRQGDPGSSKFFISLDDDLMRMFAGPRIKGIMQRLGLKDGQPIEAKMVTNAVEKAQKKVEQRNFDIRKNLIEYDDVNNGQRKAVYRMRQVVLAGMSRAEFIDTQNDVRKEVRKVIIEVDRLKTVTDKTRVSAKVANRLSHWADETHEAEIPEDALRDQESEEVVFRLASTIRGRVHGERLREQMLDRIHNVVQASLDRHVLGNSDRPELWDLAALSDDFKRAFNQDLNVDELPNGEGGPAHVEAIRGHIIDIANRAYAAREKAICSDPAGKLLRTSAGRPAYGRMRQLERYLTLQSLDQDWKEHLRNLDVIKGSIHWESYAQKDPKDAYKKKGHEVFEIMLDAVDLEVISTLFRIDVEFKQETRLENRDMLAGARVSHSGTSGMAPAPTREQARTRAQMEAASQGGPAVNTGFESRKKKLPGPNEPCHCGSGKKYKKCHMAKDRAGV